MLPASASSSWGRQGQTPPGPGLARLPLYREAVAGPARAHQTRGRCECLTPVPTVSGLYWTWLLAHELNSTLFNISPHSAELPSHPSMDLFTSHPEHFTNLARERGPSLSCKFSSCLTSVFPSYLHFLIRFSICFLHRDVSLGGKGKLSCL